MVSLTSRLRSIAQRHASHFLLGLVLAGVWATSLYRYVLFHSLVELFSVFVAFGIFTVYWNSRRFLDNGYFLFIGIAYLCVGSLDLLHALAYKGLGVFPDTSGNLANQLWIAARYLESVSMVIACVFLRRRGSAPLAVTVYAAVVAIALAAIFAWKVFPDCFIDGVGVTPFKTVSELIICGILAASCVLLVRRQQYFDPCVYRLLLASLLTTIASEGAFVYYTNPYGLNNLVGHLFKLVSFYLLYRAFIEEGFRRPYDLMFRDLAQSEARFRAVFNQAMVGIAMVSPRGRFLGTNPVFDEMLGSHPGERPWLTITGAMHPDDRPAGERKLAQVLSGESDGRPLECRFVNPDGQVVWVRMFSSLVRDADGKGTFVVAMIENITARKQTQAALQEAQQRFAAFMKHLPEVAFIKDAEGRYLYLNETAQEVFGCPAEEAVGCPTQVLWPPEAARRLRASDERVFATNQPCESIEELTRNGQTRQLLVIKFPIRDENGRPSLLGGFSIDVTEQKRAEAEIHKARLEAEAANRAKSEFLANMSHEIRTPMTAILGFTDLLMENCSQACDWRKNHAGDYLETIRRNGQHLLGLINDLLDLSKIEAGKLQVECVPCSPCQILDEALALIRPRAQAKDLGMTIRCEGLLPETILTDPMRLHQILINLAGNAVKFTDRGEVVLAVRLLDEGTAQPRMEFRVIDSGIGMSEEELGRLFRPFMQGDTSTTRKYGGTGLGLTISRRLARLMGGDITVSSRQGQGSRFTLTLPTGPLKGVRLVESSAVEPVRPQPRESKPSGAVQLHARVLLAEDGPDNQRLLTHVLRKAGAEVALAENGQMACDMARKSQEQGAAYDVILMDMQMPVMDGYEATRRLRQSGWTGPIVALTAHAMAGDRQRCLDAGCDDYLAKPIDRQTLLETVGRYTAAATGIA